MPALLSRERPDSPDARALIAELEAELVPLYPQESRHGYSVAKLSAQGVAFFVMRQDGAAAGCGGVQLYGTEYGELKRMYVRPRFRGLGLARQMVEHLADHARRHGVMRLRLETGIHQHAAIGLYEKVGFRLVPAFGTYREDPLSRFYEKELRKA
jgi:GNAT superfamily N-acetyltransferase